MKQHYDNFIDFVSDIAKAAKLEIDNMSNTQDKFAACDDNKCKDGDENPKFNGSDINLKHELKPMPGNITIQDNGNHFILNTMVSGWPTPYTEDIYFEHIDENGYKFPGITESQLLAVLYSRFKNEPKKLDLIRQLMNL